MPPQRRRRLQRRARQGRRKPRPHGGGAGRCAGPLLTAYQIHSPDVVVADEPWTHENRPRADAIVTRTPRLAIGVSTADCGPLLLADAEARVIGAAHAGWRGALTGVIEATIAAMEKLGAKRARIVAALGPTIRSRTTRSGRNSSTRFLAADAGQCALLHAVASGPATPCSISPAISPTAAATRRGREVRGPRRCAPMPSPSVSSATAAPPTGRAGLRPAYQRHRAGRLTASCGAIAARLDSGRSQPLPSAPDRGT